MRESRKGNNEYKKLQIAESLWLEYYNRVLYEKGLITEQERNHMLSMISSRKSDTSMCAAGS